MENFYHLYLSFSKKKLESLGLSYERVIIGRKYLCWNIVMKIFKNEERRIKNMVIWGVFQDHSKFIIASSRQLVSFKNYSLINTIIPLNKHFWLLNISPKITPLIPPLGKYDFRKWKNFTRKISDMILIENSKIYERSYILKMQAITHNQLSSPHYLNIWKYFWYVSGYTTVHPEYFR